MAEFNYTEYLKNNPLLQEEVKEKLLTESLEISEETPSSKTTVSALKAQIKEMILASLTEDAEEYNTDPNTTMYIDDEEWEKEMGRGVQEADEDEEVEVDVEDEIDAEVDVEPEMDAEPAMDAPKGGSEGLTADEKEIQDSLKLAYDNAVAIGDQKLADQIGNSITFFTRTHVVER